MRRIVIAVAGTISGLVLLFSYPTNLNRVGTSSEAVASGSAAVDQAGTTSSSKSSQATPVVGTFTGDVVQTRFGPVQVEITVTDGSLTSATATRYPSGDRNSVRLNARALPILVSETVSAKSASIDLVSGATITSNAYVGSLQSALDQAHL